LVFLLFLIFGLENKNIRQLQPTPSRTELLLGGSSIGIRIFRAVAFPTPLQTSVKKAITSVDEDDDRALSEIVEMTGGSCGFTFFGRLYEPPTRS
jgi:hypothetical protein